MIFALTGAQIFDGYRFLADHALVIQGEEIVELIPEENLDPTVKKIQLDGGFLSPGFIDLQINGAGGVLFNNSPTIDTLRIMNDTLCTFGVTSFLPTVITDDVGVTEQAIGAVLKSAKHIPGVLGIHIEGPFFNKKKNGVHQLDKIRTLTDDDWRWLETLKDLPAIITLAPEIVSEESVKHLTQLGLRVCAGHSNAKFDSVVQAYKQGLSGFTHLYNAMRGMSGREPGVVGAAFNLKDTWAGIIADGIHVHDASLRTAIQNKTYEKIFLVSDAMATLGSSNKTFELYGETIVEENGQLLNQEGKLAGSAISVLDAVKYCHLHLGFPLHEVLAMASRVPAEYMGVNKQVGVLKPNALANICHFSNELNLKQVWQLGHSI